MLEVIVCVLCGPVFDVIISHILQSNQMIVGIP